MNQLGRLMLKSSVLLLFLLTTSCYNQNANNASSGVLDETPQANQSIEGYRSYPTKGFNLRVSLTDAPTDQFVNVFVNISHIELFVKKNNSHARINIAENLGFIDLLTLRNGVLLPTQDLKLPEGIQITAMRLVLHTNNYAVKADQSNCTMQTPSGQQSGVKVHLAAPFTLEANHSYSMVLDFDAAKSVVQKGNGDCLLKPVLKIMKVFKVNAAALDDDGNIIDDGSGGNHGDGSGGTGGEPAVEEPLDGSNGDTNDFDPPSGGNNEPPVITIEDSYFLA